MSVSGEVPLPWTPEIRQGGDGDEDFRYTGEKTAYRRKWNPDRNQTETIWNPVIPGTLGTLENASYPVIVPGENPGKYGGIGLLGTLGTILFY